MLDEPSTGLAPRITEEIFEAIDRLKAAGMTGILVEQNAHLALSVADRGFVLEVGNVVASGDADNLRQDPRVLAAYLGAGDRYREIAADN
jgi:branched-chain amino acid transport system ATP-binding protein